MTEFYPGSRPFPYIHPKTFLICLAVFLSAGCDTVRKDFEEGITILKEGLFGSENKTKAPITEKSETGRQNAQDFYAAAVIALRDRSYKRAIGYLERADRQNFAPAALTLGGLYARGEGVSKSRRKAIYYWRRAANKGQRQAQFLLGGAYASGKGVRKDPAQAARWYGKAAWRGHKQAQFHWAIYRYDKKLFVADPISALAWVRIAGAKSSKFAVPVRKRLETQLKSSMQKVAQRERALRGSLLNENQVLFADGATIIYAQYKLKRLGFDPKGIDGKWGSGSKSAMRAFSKQRLGKESDILTPNTLAALHSAK